MVRVDNISKSYSGRTALDSLSFNVGKGEIFGLIGPDGAGKTSIFRILTSLLLPDSGSASIMGNDVVKDYRKIRNITGYMPERFSLYQDLSVEENLQFFATVFGTTIKENYHLIKDIYERLEPFKDRRAGDLSGGMKQKLALSCALIHRPEVLILDEPTTGVDAVSRKEFWEMLSEIKKEGISILVSTPYMDEAGLCDRVGLIQEGSLMKVDTPRGIVEGYKKQVLGISAAQLHKLVLDLRDIEGTESALLFGHEVHYTSRHDVPDKRAIEEYLLGKGHDQVQINEIEAGIEDVFLGLMA